MAIPQTTAVSYTHLDVYKRQTLRVETSSLQEKIDLLNKEWEEAEENVRELQKNLSNFETLQPV